MWRMSVTIRLLGYAKPTFYRLQLIPRYLTSWWDGLMLSHFVGVVGFEPTFSTSRYVYRMYKIPTVHSEIKNPSHGMTGIKKNPVDVTGRFVKDYNIPQSQTFAPAPPPMIDIADMLLILFIILYIKFIFFLLLYFVKLVKFILSTKFILFLLFVKLVKFILSTNLYSSKSISEERFDF